MSRLTVASLDGIETIDGWIPVRRHLGVEAFGVNAWTAAESGGELVAEHDKSWIDQEELYLVVRGRASFTVGGEALDAPAGTIVFVRDPLVTRAATASEPGTTILSLTAKRGEAFAPPAWEDEAAILPLLAAGEYARARELLAAALEHHGDAPGLLYNLACAEARLGDRESALDHLARAIELWPSLAETARHDPDLETVRVPS